jgi:hypothetical protein
MVKDSVQIYIITPDYFFPPFLLIIVVGGGISRAFAVSGENGESFARLVPLRFGLRGLAIVVMQTLLMGML